jgi:hypothetical protein
LPRSLPSTSVLPAKAREQSASQKTRWRQCSNVCPSPKCRSDGRGSLGHSEQGRPSEPGAKTQGDATGAGCVGGCRMDVAARRAGGHRVPDQSRAESGGQTFTPLREVGLVVFVCGCAGQTCKSQSNQVGGDRGATSVPRVTLVPIGRSAGLRKWPFAGPQRPGQGPDGRPRQ